jgi:uncharacterized iron-regulated membrane protein
MKNSTVRPLPVLLHFYVALLLGPWIALICLAGSLSLCGETLDRLLNPRLHLSVSSGEPLLLGRIVDVLHQAHPQLTGDWILELPSEKHEPITAWYESPEENRREAYAPLMVAVHPLTGQILANRYWGRTARTWLLDLHTRLLSGNAGWFVVGILGLSLGFTLITGLLVWWPGMSCLKGAFSLRTDAGWMRWSFDFHRNLGFFSAPLLLFLALTGVSLSFPEPLESLAGAKGMNHGNLGAEILRSSAAPNDHPILPDEAALVARGLFPKAELRQILVPGQEMGMYRIDLRQAGEPAGHHPMTRIWVDRWSGQIRQVQDARKLTDVQRQVMGIWSLHSAENLGGLAGFAWFLAGLAPSLLYLSGALRWAHRRGWIADGEIDLRRHQERLRQFAAWALQESQVCGRSVWKIFLPWFLRLRGEWMEVFKKFKL